MHAGETSSSLHTCEEHSYAQNKTQLKVDSLLCAARIDCAHMCLRHARNVWGSRVRDAEQPNPVVWHSVWRRMRTHI
jgi:hypothetical protein